jgi:hypothetical protein
VGCVARVLILVAMTFEYRNFCFGNLYGYYNCIAFIFMDFQVKNLLSVNADDEVPIKSVTIRKIPW